MVRHLMLSFVLPLLFVLSAIASPTRRPLNDQLDSLQRRTEPFFPNDPPSCPKCAENYGSINSCAQAAPVLQNFTNIIFNPGAFIDVIKCACVDTFQSTFPQCVDCFIRTGQESVLNTPDLPAVVDGMRRVCAIESTLLGNVSVVNGEVTPSASAPAAEASVGNAATTARVQTSVALIVGLALGGISLIL